MPEPPKLVFGKSARITSLLREVALYARTPHPILILGEPGVGKTAIAQLIHQQSGRAGKFVKQAASWIPAHLEVAQLAGHEKGAFTGAHEARPGLIESAHGGTFFLDELGLASAVVQQLLLQLLEDRTIRRLGEVRDRPVDVRFLGATNADLDAMVAAGSFREDLRHRFGYLVLQVPRLAERRDEILGLAESFVAREARVIGLPMPPRIAPAVRAYFQAAPWPGNIRELEAVCRYAVLHAQPDGDIELCDLPNEFMASMAEIGQHHQDRGQLHRIQAALARTKGDKAKAARLLGLSRQHLYRILRNAASLAVFSVLMS
ncbi:MAG TPA: sigma 54-interacting transcriptional regulator [Gemmatimonadales bacterium]|nr:sigma 54-interacting transcriptional regulator [Gemmatimonadales bacterium]